MWYPYNFDIKERPTCRLWNVLSLIRYADYHGNEPAIDSEMKDLKCTIETLTYNSDGSIDYDAGFNNVDFLTSNEMKTIIRDKYFTFNFATPIYFDYYTEKYEDITDDENYSNVEMAYREFYKAWALFCKDNKRNFGVLYDSIFQKYNPISNYDKHSHITLENKGIETNTIDYSGGETNTLEKKGTEKEELTKSGSENTEFAKGSEMETEYKATFDQGSDPLYKVAQTDKTGISPYPDDSRLAYKDNTKVTYGESNTPRKDSKETSFGTGNNARKDINTQEYNNRSDTSTKEFEDRIDETNEYTYGNIGVTTTQQMAISSFQLADLAHLREYIVNEFVKRYLVID